MDQDQNPAGDAPPSPPPTPEAPPAPPTAPEAVPEAPAATSAQPPAAPPSAQAAPAAPPPSYTWETPPEPVGPAPGFRFAGHPARLIAYLVDGLLIGIVVTVIAVALIAVGATASAGDADGIAAFTFVLMAVVVFVVSIGYFPYFWARSGQTPGMRIFNLRVVRDADGGPISGGQAVIRLVGLWISGAVFYLGYIWILIDKRRRGWHDLLAGTCVIETD